MTAATFILIPKKPEDPAAAAEALKFFGWAYDKGAEIEKVWASEIKDSTGKPLHTPSVKQGPTNLKSLVRFLKADQPFFSHSSASSKRCENEIPRH
jgi:hypothetical protein